MKADLYSGLSLVLCSVLEVEVRALAAQSNWPGIRLVVVNSILHIRPKELEVKLGEAVSSELSNGQKVVLIYGDCYGRMDTLEQFSGVARVNAINCSAILLGRETYRKFAREGSFFLLPEWTRRWREIFSQELGLSRENAKGLMHDMNRKFVYLDTGVSPVPEEQLKACSDHCGLPWEIVPVQLDPLRASIENAMQRLGFLPILPCPS